MLLIYLLSSSCLHHLDHVHWAVQNIASVLMTATHIAPHQFLHLTLHADTTDHM